MRDSETEFQMAIDRPGSLTYREKLSNQTKAPLGLRKLLRSKAPMGMMTPKDKRTNRLTGTEKLTVSDLNLLPDFVLVNMPMSDRPRAVCVG